MFLTFSLSLFNRTSGVFSLRGFCLRAFAFFNILQLQDDYF